MKHSPIKFICTGMCGEDHPTHDHCHDCHHAEFKTTVTLDSGKKVKLWFNMLHGPTFEKYDPDESDPIWKVVEEVAALGQRNCAKWRVKKS